MTPTDSSQYTRVHECQMQSFQPDLQTDIAKGFLSQCRLTQSDRMFSSTIAFLSILAGLFLLNCILRKRQQQIRLPPGPPRKAVIGNLGDLPSQDDRAWVFWMKHKDLYGTCSKWDMMRYKTRQ